MRRRSPLLAAGLAALVLAAPAVAQQADEPTIIVNGRGTVSYVPDRATVLLEVRTTAASAQDAAARNAALMEAVLSSMARQRIPQSRIRTAGYAVQPTYRYHEGEQTMTGYAASNSVHVVLEDVSRVGATLDTALAAGATRVAGVRFEATAFETLRRQALQRAVAAAREDAEALAAAAGGTLGALLLLTTGPEPVRPELTRAAASGGVGMVETPVNPGEQNITVTVQAHWRFLER